MHNQLNMTEAEALFDKAILTLPAPYKALLAGAAFSGLNDLGTVDMIADETNCKCSDELVIAAGIFLDLQAMFDACDWQSQLGQHIDEDRALNFDMGEWEPSFTKQ